MPALRRWLAPRLLAWYRANRRDLPWRLDRDPYRIWVSEVMLQQTQVSTVVPYFHRFLARFPTVVDLARSDEQEVLRLWEGLGYYRRARDLLAAARLFVERHDGAIPADNDALQALPGMGLYTRNAVLSQAFDLRLPIVEANVQRVLSRLLGYAEDPRETAARKRLWSSAEALLPARHVGEFHQALMELGALVCTPTAPLCDRCPLAARCVARQQGRQEEIPARAAKPATTFVSEAAVVVRREGKVLLVRRPAGEPVGVPARGDRRGRNARGRRSASGAGAGRRRGRRAGRGGDGPARHHALPDHAALLRGGSRPRRVPLRLLRERGVADAGRTGVASRQRAPAAAGQAAERARTAAAVVLSEESTR
jgi:A/G-specific adenine glycosylase